MRVKRFSIVVLAVLFLTTPAFSATYTSVVVYGDSLSDNGNLYLATGKTLPASPPYYEGRRSNGPVAVEYMAAALGAPLIDFAWIGATTGIGNYADGGTVTSMGGYNLPGMTTAYNATRASLGAFTSGGLFVVWGGPNDILAPSPLDTPAEIISRAVSNELAIVMDLKGLGAKSILVPGMPDLGLTPYFQSLGGAAAAQGTFFADAFNSALQAALPADVLYFDTAGLMRALVNNPAAYGFTDVTDPCFDGSTVCGNPDQYLFYDDFHPTTAADKIIAMSFAARVVPEPSTLILFCIGVSCLILYRGVFYKFTKKSGRAC